jgi:hypothetical protein
LTLKKPEVTWVLSTLSFKEGRRTALCNRFNSSDHFQSRLELKRPATSSAACRNWSGPPLLP